ncbi:MAG: tRNA preQ1(34) S-adenosylmethionine ribosyltransferase-isomerase QueA [Acidobacteriia bacterium]|nr:tRNA preQ1(34) S-adenosylmethionine ribosyltransferase-isomerase QueA [Terriglobia bacterium]
MKLSSFDYPLPDHLIAQHPLPERDRSRLMVVWRETGTVEHRIFRDLPEILGPDYFLVINTTRVFPARLWAQRPGRQERIEVLLVREEAPASWLALVRPARKVNPGQELRIGDLEARAREIRADGSRLIDFTQVVDLWESLERLGEPPLPPYIRREAGEDLAQDRERYQTVFARQSGSVAAPTAALHFTPEVLRRLTERGVPLCEILLHVGYGTFQPVRCEEIEEHRLEPEYYEVTDAAAAAIRKHRSDGRLLVATGTTTTRVLEHLARRENYLERGSSGFCDLFIYPGFQFRALGGLLTNFHLPRSSLFMLVCAFAGREFMLDCYRQAVAAEYRFFSYGDCMLIL